MVMISDVVVRRGRGWRQNSRWRSTVSSLEITFKLTPSEAELLPTNKGLYSMFGPADTYWSRVSRTGGELVIRYRMASCPFSGITPEEVPLMALAKVRKACTTKH